MIKDIVKAMIKTLPDVKEDGNSLLLDGNWEVTLHAGRATGVQSHLPVAVEKQRVAVFFHVGECLDHCLYDVLDHVRRDTSSDACRSSWSVQRVPALRQPIPRLRTDRHERKRSRIEAVD